MTWPADFINKVICGDCIKILPLIPDDGIDMILCDLPYGSTACAWDTRLNLDDLWCQYHRIAKPNAAIVLNASQPFASVLVMSNINNFKYEWIWKKNSSGGFLSATQRPMKYHENVMVFYRTLPTYNPIFQPYSASTRLRFVEGESVNRQKQMAVSTNQIHGGASFEGEQPIVHSRGKYPESVIDAPNDANNQRLHPTQKPLYLCRYLIETYSNAGDVILDNCAGSGTTLVAAKQLGRRYIGIEISPEYCKIAEDRLRQGELFNQEVRCD